MPEHHHPDVLDQLFGPAHRHRHTTEVQVLLMLRERIHAMALDVSKLNAATEAVKTAVDNLIASHADPAGQTAVDTAAATLTDIAAKATAAVAPAA